MVCLMSAESAPTVSQSVRQTVSQAGRLYEHPEHVGNSTVKAFKRKVLPLSLTHSSYPSLSLSLSFSLSVYLLVNKRRLNQFVKMLKLQVITNKGET